MNGSHKPAQGEVDLHISEGPFGLKLVRADFEIGSVESFTEIQSTASGGGTAPIINGYGGGSQPIRMSTTSRNYHRFFVPTPSGMQHPLTLDASNMPAQQGHWARAVWLTRADDTNSGVLTYFKNQSTGAQTAINVIPKRLDSLRGKGGGLRFFYQHIIKPMALIAAVCFALLFPLMLISDTEQVPTAGLAFISALFNIVAGFFLGAIVGFVRMVMTTTRENRQVVNAAKALVD